MQSIDCENKYGPKRLTDGVQTNGGDKHAEVYRGLKIATKIEMLYSNDTENARQTDGDYVALVGRLFVIAQDVPPSRVI
jgi:hypothetical protein